jgi:hypothetical protein
MKKFGGEDTMGTAGSTSGFKKMNLTDYRSRIA